MSIFPTLKRLLPTGHALSLFPGFQLTKLVEALAEYPALVRDFYRLVRQSGTPGQIPEDMLGEWEETYKLTAGTLTVAERNAQILARENAVGGAGRDYLEEILNDAFGDSLGYNRYVITAGGDWTCGDDDVTCGQFEDASDEAEIVIYEQQGDPAYIPGKLIYKTADDDRSALDTVSSDYWSGIFVISGPDGVGSWLELPADRETDFALKVLQIKPLSRWAIAQIHFV